MNKMNRRTFMRGSGLAAGTLCIAGTARPQAKADVAPRLQAFIVSDAHFGWTGGDQPDPAVQERAMRTILERFPKLDVFLDTGDAHHGTALKPDWGRWQDVIAGGCGQVPFYYCTGNHEQKWTERDAEAHVARLGSLVCRPYYSFDIKGIHFVAVPQLVKVNYVSRETLDWLALDLAVHKDKTTILLSHNELRGTTEYFDSIAYRQVANSNAIFALLEQHPQVVAWCHGHNHTYEIVRKGGVFFVSNGRIGGFDPPARWVPQYGNKSFGRGNLGGIYLEVGPDHVTVRAFSAAKNKFISELTPEEIGEAGGTVAHLSQTMEVKTSLDPMQPHAYCYGSGGAYDGKVQHAVRHQILGGPHARRTLYVAQAQDAAVNENGDFSAYAVKSGNFGPWVPAWDIAGTYDPGATGGPKSEESLETPGIVVKASETPSVLSSPEATEKTCGYYESEPGKHYRIRASIQSETELSGIHLEVEAFAELGQEHANPRVFALRGPALSVPAGDSAAALEWAFQLPTWDQLARESGLPEKPMNLLLGFAIHLPPHPADIVVQQVRIELADEAATESEIRFLEDENPLVLPQGHAVVSVPLPPVQRMEHTYQIACASPAKHVWLIREEGVRWQVRNAAAEPQDGKLKITAPRSDYSEKQEIILVPWSRMTNPYVHRLRHIHGAVITPFDGERIVVEIAAISDAAGEIDVVGAEPRAVFGGEIVRRTSDCTTVKVIQAGLVHIDFT